MKAPLILIPIELLLGVKPQRENSPKFWFGYRVYVPERTFLPENVRFGVVYGVEYRPKDVFPGEWWYQIRFDNQDYPQYYPENLVEKAEWQN